MLTELFQNFGLIAENLCKLLIYNKMKHFYKKNNEFSHTFIFLRERVFSSNKLSQ